MKPSLFHRAILECALYFGAPLVYAFAQGGAAIWLALGFCTWILLVGFTRAGISIRKQFRNRDLIARIAQQEEDASIAWEPDWDAKWGELPDNFAEMDTGRQLDAMDEVRIKDLVDRENALLHLLRPSRIPEAREAIREMLAAQRAHIRARRAARGEERLLRLFSHED